MFVGGGSQPMQVAVRTADLMSQDSERSTLNPGSGSRTQELKEIIMADVANKQPESVEGKFYVDDQCIDCDLCRETAPENFKRQEDGGYSYVYKQPENDDEATQCQEAMEGCPVEAIGEDG